ncbi:MAG: hypothetical protein WAU15_00210 [Nitrosomonas sp.]
MMVLTYSKSSSHLIRRSKRLNRILTLCVIIVWNSSIYAQNVDPIQRYSTIEKTASKWMQVPELFVQNDKVQAEISASGTSQKPGWIANALNWYKTKTLPGDLQFHGFVSQGYIVTTDNDVFGNSDNGGSFGFTEAGLNVSLRPLPRLLVSAQMLSRRAGEGNTGMPRLDYGFLDYRLYSHEANQFGIRVGRLKNPFGFYNDTRDMAFTRPSILLPQSIYFDRTRNLGLSGDSVQLYGDAAVSSWGTFSTQFGVWLPIVTDGDTEISLLGTRPSQSLGHLNRDVSYIGRGLFESNDKSIRLAISGIWLNSSYDPNNRLKDPMGPGAFQFTPIYFSAQYNTERWSLTGEYALRSFKYDNNFGLDVKGEKNNPLNGLDMTGESFYVQGDYRFNPKWEGFIRYDVFFADRSDRNGSKWVAEDSIKRKGLEHSRYARDFTVGLRWNITPEFMLRAEYHHVNGTGWLSRLDNPIPAQTVNEWDLFAIQASYRF